MSLQTIFLQAALPAPGRGATSASMPLLKAACTSPADQSDACIQVFCKPLKMSRIQTNFPRPRRVTRSPIEGSLCSQKWGADGKKKNPSITVLMAQENGEPPSFFLGGPYTRSMVQCVGTQAWEPEYHVLIWLCPFLAL